MNADVIRIHGLKVEAHVGVTDEERATAQTLIVNVEIEADLAPAGRSDELADSVDYDELATEIAALVRAKESKLLERVAHDIASAISRRKGVAGVTVEVIKPSPPTVEDVGEVGVKIVRRA